MKDDNRLKQLKALPITDEGFLDLARFPIEVLLRQAVGEDEQQFRSACTLLSVMHCAGRIEAGVFLLGLLKFCGDDRARKALVVDALKNVRTRPAADLLFSELEQTDGSSSNRAYVNAILKTFRDFPAEVVQEGFERLLSESRWSSKMKRRFREILEGLD